MVSTVNRAVEAVTAAGALKERVVGFQVRATQNGSAVLGPW